MFKLEEEKLLLTAGKSRWLPFATREVEQVLERLRENGLERAMESRSSVRNGAPATTPSLRSIIAAAPPMPGATTSPGTSPRSPSSRHPSPNSATRTWRTCGRRPRHPGDPGYDFAEARPTTRAATPATRKPARNSSTGTSRPMTSSFGGLNTAYTGLVAARAGLTVVGDNISNSTTVGYSRQEVTTTS